jgi:predicted DNA-binding protein (UPF0251 family)
VDDARREAIERFRAKRGFDETDAISLLAYAPEELPTSIRAMAIAWGIKAQRRAFSRSTFHRVLQEHPEARPERIRGIDGKSYPARRGRRVASDEVLRLRYDEGWSFQRIAEHFGLSRQTVARLIYRWHDEQSA